MWKAQKDKDSGYPLTKRGIYYCSRLISAQKEAVFQKMDYGKIRKVYSIWILMKSSKEEQNSITEYALEERLLTGSFCSEKKDYDLMALVILTLGDADKAKQEILQLLDTVFTSDLNTEQISTKLKDDFGLVLTPKMEQELSEMCNLSTGIEERGIEKGIALGISQGISQGISLNGVR